MLWIWLFFIFLIVNIFIGVIEKENSRQENQQNIVFLEMPVHIGGYILQGSNISELHLSIKNNTQHTVSAVRFLVECYNVYGEKMPNCDKSCIYQTNCIESGKVRTALYGLPKNTKSIKLYIYSVYYKNNSYVEWGSRNLTKAQVKNYAPTLHIEYAY